MAQTNQPADQKRDLIDACYHVARQIDKAWDAWEVCLWLVQNMDVNRDYEFDLGLRFIRDAALNETILAVGRIFDRSEKAASINRAITELQSSHIFDQKPFIKYLSGLGCDPGLKEQEDRLLLTQGIALIKQRMAALEDEMRRIKEIRDTQIAHHDWKQEALNLLRGDIEKCLSFAELFTQMTGLAFATHGLLGDRQQPVRSLAALCLRAGIVASIGRIPNVRPPTHDQTRVGP